MMRHFTPQTLIDLDVLSQSECERARTEVLQSRSWWIPRDPPLPFYTLGAASYLDAAGRGAHHYMMIAGSNNPVLSSTFLWLQERACEALSRMLDEPVSLHPRLALPGFHIFLAHEAFARENAASAHWDLQFGQIEWLTEEEPDFTTPLSFTLPVSLPASGGGLNLWDLSHEEGGSLSPQQREARKQQLPLRFHAYSLGRMVVHSGLCLHQIAPMAVAAAGQERITYQGHALRCAGKWQLYW